MSNSSGSRTSADSNLALIVLMVLIIVLWLAGGASRIEVMGQPIVRTAAWTALVIQIAFGNWVWGRRPGPVGRILAAAIALLLVQLVPLPPQLWLELPGRQMFAEAAAVAGLPQPWRPISISPASTGNALGSLVVPLAVLVLSSRLDRKQGNQILTLLVILVFASCLLGMLQMAGATFDNPLINDVRGSVSGNFANPNHFALFIAIGCLLLPVWAFLDDAARNPQKIACGLLVPLFVLVALGTGSRTGIVLVIVGLCAGGLAVRDRAATALNRMPRKLLVGSAFGLAVLLAASVAISIALGRAFSIERAFSLQAADDLRHLARPIIWSGVMQYLPFGTGFGTFDIAYRIAEPEWLLQPTYLNHAHNDWLELLLDGGLLAAFLVAGAVLWWGVVSYRVWRDASGGSVLGRAGSAIVLLVFVASAVDYPARTPLLMAVIALSAFWLERASRVGTKRGRAMVERSDF